MKSQHEILGLIVEELNRSVQWPYRVCFHDTRSVRIEIVGLDRYGCRFTIPEQADAVEIQRQVILALGTLPKNVLLRK